MKVRLSTTPLPSVSWRDPKMPVVRRYKMRDGTVTETVDPDYERAYREFMLGNTVEPDWHRDPTYNLRRKK